MRIRLRMLVVGVVGFASLGCVHPSSGLNGLTGGGWSDRSSATTAPAAPELPAKPAAALCLSMAQNLEKDGKDADAVGYYERARELDPSLQDRASRRLAVLYDRTDNQARAMAEFQEQLKKKPKDANLLNDMGYSYYNRAQWADAETYLRRAIAADKNHKSAWVNLGLTLAQQGRNQEAVDAFLKVVTPAEAHANLGFVLAVQGKKAEAVAAYRQALELEPTLRLAQIAVAKLESPEPPTLVPASTSSSQN